MAFELFWSGLVRLRSVTPSASLSVNRWTLSCSGCLDCSGVDTFSTALSTEHRDVEFGKWAKEAPKQAKEFQTLQKSKEKKKKWHYSMFSSKTYLLQPWFPRKCTCSSQNSDRSVPGLLSASLQRLGNLPSSREFRRSSVQSGGPWTSVQCQCVQDLSAPPADCTPQEMATGSGKTSVMASNKDIRGIQKLQSKNNTFYWASVLLLQVKQLATK